MKNLQDKAVITLQPYATKLFRKIQSLVGNSTLRQNIFINSIVNRWLIDRSFISLNDIKKDYALQSYLVYTDGLSKVLKKEKWTTERSSS